VTHEQIDNLVKDIRRMCGLEHAPPTSVLRSLVRNAVALARLKPGGPQEPMIIDIASIVSARDNSPVIQMSWGDQQGQLSPGEARDHAERLRRAADAAESDAFLFHFLTTETGLDPDKASWMLHSFREFREERARKDYLPR